MKKSKKNVPNGPTAGIWNLSQKCARYDIVLKLVTYYMFLKINNIFGICIFQDFDVTVLKSLKNMILIVQ